ncbi:M17 family peptidase N-terminal domain-containing protein, partial [Rhizobium ruizarguesonis]
MSVKMEISFSKSAKLNGGLAILLKTAEADSAAGAEAVDPAGVIAKAARIARFSAKSMGALDIVAPEGAPVERIVVIGLGKAAELTAHDWLKAG